MVSAAPTALPTSRATRINPQPFRVWLCRRLFSHSRCLPPLSNVFKGSCVGLQRFPCGAGGCSSVEGGKRTCGIGTSLPGFWTFQPTGWTSHTGLSLMWRGTVGTIAVLQAKGTTYPELQEAEVGGRWSQKQLTSSMPWSRLGDFGTPFWLAVWQVVFGVLVGTTANSWDERRHPFSMRW